MRVMSVNVCCWGDGKNSVSERAPLIEHLIRTYEPDVIGVQEATVWWMAYLKAHLPQYASIGIGREKKGQGEASPVFFRKDRFDLRGGDTFWLSETPRTVSRGWDAACNRVCTIGRLLDLQSGKAYSIFNTHLDHIGPQAQLNGIRLINQKIREEKNASIILTGDFNVEPDSSVYAEVFLQDARISSGTEDSLGTYHDYGRIPDEKSPIIDYCFHSGDIEVKSYQVLRETGQGGYATDHYAVLVELID